MVKFLISFILFAIVANKVILAETEETGYHKILKARLLIILKREYSIKKISDIWIGVVNYPQWFVSLSTGRYYGLTFAGKVRGSESLYPTNITQERWMFNFNAHSKRGVENCSSLIKGWTDIENLELVMYSQMMNICLSNNVENYPKEDNKRWYKRCWLKYHKDCKYKG